MTLWTLEIARVVRTRRWMMVAGVFAVFGVVGPLTARYISEIIGRVGGDIQITVPDPRPADGIAQFIGNSSQLGLLAVIVVAAAAMAGDNKPELAAFLRTKVERASTLLLAPYVVTVAIASAALVLGTGLAWAITGALLGGLPAASVVIGTLYGVLYLAFAVATVAVLSTVVSSQVTAVFSTVGVLILMPLLGVVDAIKPWLPSELLTAVAPMVDGTGAGAYARAVLVTLAATAGALALAARRMDLREL